ncbi:hypothetical protein BD311DRAFT_661722 [Dichomitus squalens]|uniref:F-box domain-containing protein n=1 Tax=Dichomitus squalens TaxID=114155 RepID=A0A4Q9MQB1_9APHY|nr:hypothetical protein BD311DRAFT_661722 [Dichomitus squalens]
MPSAFLEFFGRLFLRETSAKSGDREVYRTPPTSSVGRFIPLQLPLELWVEVLSFVSDRRTLVQLMLVNHAFHDITETLLYRTVVLKSHYTIPLLDRALKSSAKRAKFVHVLELTESTGYYPFLPTLSNLRYLTLIDYDYRDCVGQRTCDAVLTMCFPHLRGFTTNLPITSASFLDSFLTVHQKLDELDISRSQYLLEGTVGILELWTSLRSLRVLGYHSPFFSDSVRRRRTPTKVTHLYRPICTEPELSLISSLMPQLVSLRLGGRRGGWNTPWSLYDVAVNFPHLRFLQLDMLQGDTPTLSKTVIDWTLDRSQDIPPRPSSEPRMTVAWMYTRNPRCKEGSIGWADAWDKYLDAMALEVFRVWGDYVGQIKFRHTEIPLTSLTLQRSGRVSRSHVIDRRDDHWKRI